MAIDTTTRDRSLFRVLGRPRDKRIVLPRPELVDDMMGQPIHPTWLTMGVYVLEKPRDKTTYCTAGLSNPIDPPLVSGTSGLGYELCMESPDEAWAIDCLMTLLFYQLASVTERRPGRMICPGEWLPLRPLLPVPEGTNLRALAATCHPASPIDGESGRIRLVRLVGITKRELAWLVAESVPIADLIERLETEVGRSTALARPDLDVPDVDIPAPIAKYCV